MHAVYGSIAAKRAWQYPVRDDGRLMIETDADRFLGAFLSMPVKVRVDILIADARMTPREDRQPPRDFEAELTFARLLLT